MLTFSIFIISLFFIELLYFKIANHYNIIDKPNQRSSHQYITLRVGGIIFPVAIITAVFIYQPSYWYLALAVFAIALISFLDDVITLNNKVRLGVHFLAVLLVIYQANLNQPINYAHISYPSYLIFAIIAFIMVIGTINAYNFMDGINGITVLYSIVLIASFYLIQELKIVTIIHPKILTTTLAALIVFGYFNLRKRAKAFAGDVGSISIALFICFFIVQLIMTTGNFQWILLLGIYGLDAVATIFCRLIRKENIFEAHRSHFYQYLANEKKINHVVVAGMYGILQMMLNLVIIYTSLSTVMFTFFAIVLMYIMLRLSFEGRNRLFISYQ